MNVLSIRKTVKQILPGKSGKWFGEEIAKVGGHSLFVNPDCPTCDCFPAAMITNQRVLLL